MKHVLLTALALAAVRTTASQEMEQGLKALTAAIKETSSRTPHGAGVLIGLGTDAAYIVTARHVVFEGNERSPVPRSPLAARFSAQPAEWHRVDSVLLLSWNLDVALLVVSVTGDLWSALRTVPDFQRRAFADDLDFGDAVYPVGCPSLALMPVDEPCFQRPVAADRFVSGGGGRIYINTRSIEPGHSGGPLFNAEWEIVGMVRGKTEAGEAEVITMDTIFTLLPAKIRASGSTSLQRRGIPRAGFDTRLEYAVLFPAVAPSDAEQGERWPGGRLGVTRSLNRLVSAHGAYLRLAPEDLDIKGGAVGLTLDPWWGGVVSLRFFAEVGVANVQARILGSPYLVGTETKRTVSRAQAVGLGIGVGVAPRITVPPGITLFAVLGHYRFGRPEGAADLPAVVYGAGVGWGLR